MWDSQISKIIAKDIKPESELSSTVAQDSEDGAKALEKKKLGLKKLIKEECQENLSCRLRPNSLIVGLLRVDCCRPICGGLMARCDW